MDPKHPESRRRIGRAARLWGELTLGGIVLVAVFTIWHLVRRGRLLRDRLGPARFVRSTTRGRIRPRFPMTTPRATFRPHERLRGARAFQRAFDRRRSAADERLVVYVVENGLDHARLGISLGRKRVRKATARNRIKRLVREAFRLHKAELPVGVDLVVVPRGGELTLLEAAASLTRLAQAAAARLGRRPGPPRP